MNKTVAVSLKANLVRVAAEAKADEQDRGRIKSITIENFKGIGDEVKIPIRPITLLFGKNSSGKSTVLQALRYHYFIRHTELESKIGYKSSSQIDMVGGHNIDLANFSSLVHRQEHKDRKIRVRITYAPKAEGEESSILLWEEVITSWRKNPHPKKLKLENTHVESILLGYLIYNEEKCFIASGDKPKAVVGSKGKKLDPINLESDDTPLGTQTALMRKSDQLIQINLGKAIKAIKEPKKLDAVRHLGPFREVPFDDEKRPQMTDESQWEKGAGAWEALVGAPELLKRTNNYMQNVLKLRYSINQLNHEDNDIDITKLLHKDNDEDNGIDIGLSDVGIGISQIIPVVVGALDNSQASGIFAVEQPELHIHPALQVALGDVFIDAVKSNNRTILIETHSEHLLLRLLRRVRDTSSTSDDIEHKLTPNDLSVFYVQSTPKGATFTLLSVTDDGDFDESWPEGFFEERIEELF